MSPVGLLALILLVPEMGFCSLAGFCSLPACHLCSCQCVHGLRFLREDEEGAALRIGTWGRCPNVALSASPCRAAQGLFCQMQLGQCCFDTGCIHLPLLGPSHAPTTGTALVWHPSAMGPIEQALPHTPKSTDCPRAWKNPPSLGTCICFWLLICRTSANQSCTPVCFSVAFLPCLVLPTPPWIRQWGHLVCTWTRPKAAPTRCRTEAAGCGSWVHPKDCEHHLLPSMQASELLSQTPACFTHRHNHLLEGFGKPALENLPSAVGKRGSQSDKQPFLLCQIRAGFCLGAISPSPSHDLWKGKQPNPAPCPAELGAHRSEG